MNSNRMGAALLCAAALTSGCAGLQQRINGVVEDHRGTEKWTKSSEAFKTIMRKYVHAGNDSITDEELDDHFEQYITLSEGDVRDFIMGQSCLPTPGSGPARYYMVNSTHQRHDAFFATDEKLPIHGSGSKRAHASFSANLLMERHTISASLPMPARAAMPAKGDQPGSPFPTWASLSKAMTDEATFKATFQLHDAAQRKAVFAGTSAVDWSKASGELFIAPTLEGGDIFSPALFAVYVLRPDPNGEFSVFLVISADAEGDPKTPYVGLINDKRDDYHSVTGFAFTYLSSADNLLNYDLIMTGTDPVTFEVWITTAYPDHPDQPYLTVRSPFVPAVSENMIASYKDEPGVKLIMMVRKGALMRDLIEMYFPESSEAQLWKDVGALKEDDKFKDKLEAAGLDVAVDIFNSDLWLEKPEVGSETKPVEYELRPGMELKCEDKAKGQAASTSAK